MSDEKIKVLITVPFSEDVIQRLKDVSPRLEINHRPARNYTDIIADVWADAEVLYTASVFPPAESTPKLKWLQSHSAGVDTVLQQPIVKESKDLMVTTTSGIHATKMAEYVIGLFLSFGHRIPQIMQAQRRHEWTEDRHDKFLPKELREATVGIVGYGSIGREIARLAKAFGSHVLASKRDVKIEADTDTFILEDTGDPEGIMFDRLYPPQALASMVKECDFVAITVPLTPETRGLYGEKVIKAMKKGSFLVNVGRGGVVDEDALLEALKSEHLGGAAMDVFETEPLPEDSPLWDAPNFILTPHLAGNSANYHAKAAQVFEENLHRYVDKKTLMNLVNRGTGY